MITEESFIDFKCPYCGETISFPRESAGYAQACPICTESVIVPGDGSGEGRKPPLPITTARLVLRRFAGGDWKDLLECLADEEVFRYLGGRPLEEEEVLRWLERDSQVRLTTPEQMFYLGIQEQEGGKLIGYLVLNFTEACQTTLEVVLNRTFQGKGFALEAVQAVLGFCFEGIRLHRVSAWCDSRNAPACKLFEKAGLRREGELVKSKLFNGQWVNVVCYAALEEDYLGAAASGAGGGGSEL